MQNIQVGIPGLAPDKDLNKAVYKGKVLRKKLYDYIRGKLGTDQSGFARMMSISPATVSLWLFTERMPSCNVMLRMANNLGLTYQELYDLFKVEHEQHFDE